MGDQRSRQRHLSHQIFIASLVVMQLISCCNGYFYSENNPKGGDKNCFCEVNVKQRTRADEQYQMPTN